MQPVPFGPSLHADQHGAVVEAESGPEYLVEQVDETLVSQHPAERLAPRTVEREWVLPELAASVLPPQLLRVLSQACRSVADEMLVRLDGLVGEATSSFVRTSGSRWYPRRSNRNFSLSVIASPSLPWAGHCAASGHGAQRQGVVAECWFMQLASSARTLPSSRWLV